MNYVYQLSNIIGKKVFSTLFLIIIISIGATAQSSYTVSDFPNAGNPGGLNTQTDATTSGWTTIIAGPQAVNIWSPVQTIPFPFQFFGNTVTQYKVSQNGLITFDITATSPPPNANGNLPDPSLPDNTIAAMWDEFTSAPSTGSGDNIYYQVFGTAPNRQLWIRWYSFEYGNPNVSFQYFGAILEETTNKIFIIDQYGSSSPLLTTTVGVQLNSSMAVQFGNNTIPQAGNGSGNTDNDYWEFNSISLVANDAGISSIDQPTQPIALGIHNIEVTITNFGTATLTSADINWMVNGAPQSTFSYSGSIVSQNSDNNVNIGSFSFATTGLYTISAWTTNPNGTADPNTYNDTTTMSYFACNSLSGIYTINPVGGDFPSIQSAVDAMALCNIAGPVTLNVISGSGPYNEQVIIPEIAGANATNTITFNGNGETIAFASENTNQRAVFKLDGADYITINDFIINYDGGTYGWGIHLTNQANFNNITNNVINGNTTSTSANYCGIAISGSNTSFGTQGDNANNLLISGNTIIGGQYGISNRGQSGNLSVNNQIINNIIQDTYTYNIYNQYQSGLIIKGNDISRPNRTVSSLFNGIHLVSGISNCLIENNRFHNTHDVATDQTDIAYGIWANVSAAPGEETQIINNIFYNFSSSSGAVYPIYISGDGVRVYHNTISLDNTSATGGITRGISVNNSGYTNIDIRNNIVFLTRGGSDSKHGLYSASTTITVNNNVVYAPADNYGYWGSDQATVADFNLASGFQQNISADPVFANPLTGDFTPTNNIVNNAGTGVGVAFDIIGNPRDPVSPDPGALEFTPVGLDANITWVAPVNPVSIGANPVIVNINNSQTATINSVSLTYTDGVISETQTFSSLGLTTGANIDLAFTTPYNLSGSADLRAYINTVNGLTDNDQSNDTTITVTICNALSGIYTINSGAATGGTNFNNFNDAVNKLIACGISGPVVFDVTVGSGPYNEQFALPEIIGSSATNTIAFNGNGETLAFSSSISTERAVIRLQGADYVTIDNFVVDATGAGTYGWGIHLMSASNNITISNNTVNTDATSTSSVNYVGIVASNSLTSPTSSGNNTNNTIIINNTVIGGYYGIRINGTSTSVLASSNQILNNTVSEVYYYGIYNIYQDEPIIKGNIVIMRAGNTSSYGIYTSNADNGFEISSNKVINWGSYGLYFTSSNDATNAGRAIIANNMIGGGVQGTGTEYGIYITSSDNIDIWHNSVNVDNGNSRGLYALSSATGLDIRNNSFAYTAGGTGYAMYIAATSSIIMNDFNNYYSAGSNFVFYGTAKADLAALQATNIPAGNDAYSKQGDPQYLGPLDLHSIELQLNNAGTPIAQITVDIDGETRNAANPDIGADEYTPPPFDISVVSLDEPAIGGCFAPSTNVAVEVMSNGTDPIDFSSNNLTLTANITGPLNQIQSTTVTTGLLNPGSNLIVTLGSVDLTLAGSYVFNLTASMPGDGLSFNNNLVVNVSSSGESPVITSTTSDTTCGIGDVTLSATTNFGTLAWYDAPSGGNQLGTGSTYTTTISTTTDFYVQSESGYVSGSLDAMPLQGGNGCGGGNMFNITPSSSLDLTGFDMNLGASAGTSVDVGIYFKIGTYVGSQTTAGDWTFHQTVTVTAAGPNNPTFVPVAPLSLGAGTLYGIYLNADVDYTNITPTVTFSNSDMTIELGDGLCSLFGGNNAGRGFNGTVHYNAGCASERVAVTAVSTPAEQIAITGSLEICEGSSTNLTAASTTSYVYNWEPAAGLNTTSGATVIASPISTTTYVVTGDDGTCVDTDTVEVVVWPTSIAGTASLLSDTICTGADATLILDGNTGTIQWQENTGSGWVDITGATTSPYVVIAPASGTQFRAVVTNGVCASINSNELTVTTVTPVILSTNDDTRCGPGTVNLSATANSVIEWYDAPTGGNLVATGENYVPFITSTTDYYVQASVGGGAGVGSVLITEVDLGGTDMLEIQNVSGAAIDVTGWKVAVSDNYTNINSVNSIVQTLNGIINPGDVIFWTDGTTNDWGNNLFWNPGSYPSFTGWAMILDNNDNIIDFAIWNWPSANIQSMSPLIGSTTITIGNQWSGDGIDAIGADPLTLSRQGNTDDNDLSDFILLSSSQGFTNPGLNLPFAGAGCSSARTLVTATVTPAPEVTISSSALVSCGGAPVDLTANSTNNNYQYTWQPGGQTGAMVTVTPTVNTTYIVHAVDISTGCENYDTLDLEVVDPPTVNVTASGTFFCDVANTQLVADVANMGNYSVNSILFAPLPGSGTSVSLTDDAVSSALPIGFNFDFYGNSYTDFYISSNGFLAFNNPNISDNGCCEGQSLPNTSASNPHNLIAFAWEDLDPDGVGTIEYFTTGTAPNRILVVNFIDIPHFPGPGPTDNITSQILLYEGSDIIEIHTTAQPATTGNHTMGIENYDGTQAAVVPGRNGEPWTAFNDAYQFAPQTYTYNWSPTSGLSNPSISDPVATPTTTTNYIVVVTDNETGCTSIDSVTIVVGITPTPVISSTQTMPLCEGESTTLSTQYSAANGFQFSWNSGLFTSESITVNLPGTYTCLVTSPEGCTSTMVSFVVEVATIFADLAGSTDVLCYGDSTGTATINALGTLFNPSGVVTFGPFVYSANGGVYQISPTLTGLWAGTNIISVYDSASGCTINLNVSINEPSQLIAGPVTINNQVSCNGMSDGSATVSASGGTGPYTINWNTPIPKQGELNEEIPAGTWTVTVTDANGCTALTTVTITEPDPLTNSFTIIDATYWDAYNGSVTANPYGGTAPYTYLWSTGATIATIESLHAGSYTVTITDFNGCVLTETAIVNEPAFDCVDGTQTHFIQGPGGWGGQPSGNNPATYLYANFAAAFPNGLTIGHPAGMPGGCNRSITLTTEQAVTDFLPSAGQPRRLDVGHQVNITASQYGNILASMTVALTLGVVFDTLDPNFSPASTVAFGSMVYIGSGPYNGMTVYQILDAANEMLACGGKKNEISQLNTVIDNILHMSSVLGCPSSPVVRNITHELIPIVEDEILINIHPNPTSGIVNISFESDEINPSSILIMDLQGRILMDLNNELGSNFKREIDISQFENGLYIINIINHLGIIKSTRIIKVK